MNPGLILLAIPFALLGGYGIASTLIRLATETIRIFCDSIGSQDCDR